MPPLDRQNVRCANTLGRDPSPPLCNISPNPPVGARKGSKLGAAPVPWSLPRLARAANPPVGARKGSKFGLVAAKIGAGNISPQTRPRARARDRNSGAAPFPWSLPRLARAISLRKSARERAQGAEIRALRRSLGRCRDWRSQHLHTLAPADPRTWELKLAALRGMQLAHRGLETGPAAPCPALCQY